MKRFHITINGTRRDVAASQIKTAISRALELEGFDRVSRVTIEARLSNAGDVFNYQFSPAREARDEERTYLPIEGKRWVRVNWDQRFSGRDLTPADPSLASVR